MANKFKKLDCGHPKDCWGGDYEDDMRCLWCEEVRNLESHAKVLRKQLYKTAIVIHGGEHVLTIVSDIGVLEIRGGNVDLKFEPTATTIDTLNVHPGANVGSKGEGDDAGAKRAIRECGTQETDQT